MRADAIKTNRYLSVDEIWQNLQNLSHIIMATPAPDKFPNTPIHFTIFLNTQERLPADIQKAVLEKFREENKISEPAELLSELMPVGFGESTQETAMPMLLIKQQDMANIPHVGMFVFDFLADSPNFDEAKVHKLTGWSYSYEE